MIQGLTQVSRKNHAGQAVNHLPQTAGKITRKPAWSLDLHNNMLIINDNIHAFKN
jgi:hypothetical protein